jgi:hypothetical protein
LKGLLKSGIIICMLSLTLLSGCTVLSLFPFYQGKELIHDDRLIGLWNHVAIDPGSRTANQYEINCRKQYREDKNIH